MGKLCASFGQPVGNPLVSHRQAVGKAIGGNIHMDTRVIMVADFKSGV